VKQILLGGIVYRIIFALCFLATIMGSASGEPVIFYASSSGHRTLDQGEGGGNPFASSLIEVLGRPETTLADFPEVLRALTFKKSHGYQNPEVPDAVASGDWKFAPHAQERRTALVMVISDYQRSGADSLPGAEKDARRVANALLSAGFSTEEALNLDLKGMRRKLNDFAAASASFDAAVIYTTGHGVESQRTIYLIPGDYPLRQGNSALPQKALPLSEIAKAAHAKNLNLIFYGGCRDDPFSPSEHLDK
jgi:Caspase domain